MEQVITTFSKLFFTSAAGRSKGGAPRFDLLLDSEKLHAELANVLPEDQIPEIIPVDSFDELSVFGEFILCLDALRRTDVV